MARIPNLRQTEVKRPSPNPYYYIDTPFDYRGWVSGEQPVAAFEDAPRVAVIGAGAAGLCAGYELLRAGADVTVYEQSDRIGGRCYSKPFEAEPSLFAEMGAMRVPFSEQAFFFYADRFGVRYSDTFPDPGLVDTVLRYRGRSHLWKAGKPVPDIFRRVDNGWKSLVDNDRHEFSIGGKAFRTPGYLAGLLNSGDRSRVFSEVVPAWQDYIDHFRDKSFFTAMVEIFATNPDAPPGGERWDYPEDFKIFGALGIGSGGFKPLYQEGFLEILRIVANGLEEDQQFIISGVSALCEGFANEAVAAPGGKRATLSDRIRMNSTVSDAVRKGAKWQLKVDTGSGAERPEFDYVISTISPRALQVILGPGSGDWRGALGEDVTYAVENLHMISSSKCFVVTESSGWPVENIQSDTLFRSMYCLKYPGSERGVVLMSYTWEEDARKFPGLGADPSCADHRAKRYGRLLQDIDDVWPKMGDFLRKESLDIVDFIDWDNEYGHFGAFELPRPGHEPFVRDAFFQFQQCTTPDDPRFYIAGDSISWTGGWIEGALHTGLNAAAAVMHSAGLRPRPSPVTDLDPDLYDYAKEG